MQLTFIKDWGKGLKLWKKSKHIVGQDQAEL